MKTTGIIYAYPGNIALFLALAAASSVFAQNDQGRQNISPAPANNRLATADTYDHALANSASRQSSTSQRIFSLPITNNSETPETEPDYRAQSEVGLMVRDQNRTKPFGKNLEISFRPTSFVYPEGSREEVGVTEYPTGKLLLYAIVMKQYARQNGLDTTYAFISNMGMLSIKKRFFVINLVTMEVERSGLVSQGRGQGRTKYDKQYSNIIESKCTSLGRYKIGNKYKGSYGESYRLMGLDSTNQNAFKRNIVLHPMGCIPDDENIAPTCISEGCPAVSSNFLLGLSKIIDTREKPVLLWVFDSNLEEVIAEEIPTGKYHTCSIHYHETHDLP